MKKQFQKLILLSVITAAMWSCKSKCPLPSCHIRTEHHHALNFKNTRSYKKEQLKEAKRIEKEEQDHAKAQEDSLATAEQKQRELNNLDAEHDKELQKVKIVEEQKKEKAGKESETDIVSDNKESKKKKKKKNSGEEGEEEVNEELASTGKAAKKEIKLADKESKKLQKESDRVAAKENSETKEAEAVYKSRLLPWWKKNQNPKVGQDYDLPERNEEKGRNEYTW